MMRVRHIKIVSSLSTNVRSIWGLPLDLIYTIGFRSYGYHFIFLLWPKRNREQRQTPWTCMTKLTVETVDQSTVRGFQWEVVKRNVCKMGSHLGCFEWLRWSGSVTRWRERWRHLALYIYKTTTTLLQLSSSAVLCVVQSETRMRGMAIDAETRLYWRWRQLTQEGRSRAGPVATGGGAAGRPGPPICWAPMHIVYMYKSKIIV